MVPADDAQEPEPTTPQITAGNKPPTASSDSTARLTPMPAWLMHWWTPLAIAEGLLRWPLLLAIFWGGQPHWPSSGAMKLCVTIVGAGLAFSAWQQRSHDNVAKEKQERATIERDDAASTFSIFSTQRILAYASVQSHYSQNWLTLHNTANY